MANRLTLSLVLISGLWLELRLVAYVLQQFDTKRYHVESAAFIFCFALLVRGLAAVYPREAADAAAVPANKAVLTPLIYRAMRSPITYIVGALIIYWPILGIGLLSDDYVLVARASDLAVLSDRDFFRPLPLFIWALLKKVLRDPGVYAVALHLLTVTLTA